MARREERVYGHGAPIALRDEPLQQPMLALVGFFGEGRHHSSGEVPARRQLAASSDGGDPFFVKLQRVIATDQRRSTMPASDPEPVHASEGLVTSNRSVLIFHMPSCNEFGFGCGRSEVVRQPRARQDPADEGASFRYERKIRATNDPRVRASNPCPSIWIIGHVANRSGLRRLRQRQSLPLKPRRRSALSACGFARRKAYRFRLERQSIPDNQSRS